MPEVVVSAQPRALELEAKIIRCGCTPEQKTAPGWHALSGKVCPRPRAVEDLGVVSAWYRSPFKRLAWNLTQFWKALKEH